MLKFFKIAATFGLFQGAMPVMGWYLGAFVKVYLSSYGNIVAASVFGVLGLKTIYDAVFSSKKEGELCPCECNNPFCLLSLAVATSIDAFLVGMVFSLLNVDLYIAIPIVTVITLVVSLGGLFVGLNAGQAIGKKATVLAGIILLALAAKTLI